MSDTDTTYKDPHDCAAKPACRSDIFGEKSCKCYAQDLSDDSYTCADGTLNCKSSEQNTPSTTRQFVCADGSLNCDPSDQTVRINKWNQFCAYEGADGFLYPCDSKCCNDGVGCPGECDGAPAAKPQGVPTYNPEQSHDNIVQSTSEVKFNTFLKAVAVIVVTIVVVNFLILLFFGGTSKNATKNAPQVIKFIAGVNRSTLNGLKSILEPTK